MSAELRSWRGGASIPPAGARVDGILGRLSVQRTMLDLRRWIMFM